ncbi:unnamed protein product [Hapterophycus canaliculatus]
MPSSDSDRPADNNDEDLRQQSPDGNLDHGSPYKPPDQGPDQCQDGRVVDGEREREAGEGVAGDSSNTHYYFKLSSTLEKRNDFVERSLPFFVPPPPSESIDDVYSEHFDDQYTFDTSPANEGEYTTGRQGNQVVRKREGMWLGQGWRPFDGRYKQGEAEGQEQEELEGRREAKGGGDDITEGVESFDDVNIFLRNPFATKGIHCRLGMDGVMSDGHYDGSRNMVALLAGKRRWILSKPQNCGKMHMFRKGHPSARHTAADWTDTEVALEFPDLTEATANEVILRAGEALYVPEHWIHSIVNIGVSAQCNSRSGKSFRYHPIIRECEEEARAG